MKLPGLKRERHVAGFSQEALAEESGVHRDSIQKLETGQRPARPATIKKLANALGVDSRELVSGRGGENMNDVPPMPEEWAYNMRPLIEEKYDFDEDEMAYVLQEVWENLHTRVIPSTEMMEQIFLHEANRLYVPGKGANLEDVRKAAMERVAELTKLAVEFDSA